MFSPFYSYHVNLLELLGVEVRYVDLTPPDWSYCSDELAAAFTDRTPEQLEHFLETKAVWLAL